MSRFPKLAPLGLLALFGAAFCAAAAGASPIRILYFTKSAGYEHSVIKEADGQPSYSERILQKLAAAHQFEVTFSKDGSKFSPDYFARFDVVMFYTSGDLCSVGTDGHPAVKPAGKQALLDAIAGGKGFVGLHSCSDTWHTGEQGGGNNPNRGHRYHNDGDAADPFVRMLGGEFIRHDAQQVATARVADPAFPGFGGLGGALRVKEEWYTLKNFAADDHVLLVLETTGMEGPDYARPDYPLAWARAYGRGRVFYTAMGHREDVWDSAAYQAMLVGAIEWAAGRAHADVTGDLAKVAPGALTLQKYVPPVKPAKK